MATYRRIVAYYMRGFIALWWLGALLIPMTWSSVDWPPIFHLLLFYLFGAFITSLLWGVTVIILKIRN